MQPMIPGVADRLHVQPFKTQLLKWIGNKQRFAHEIASYFPTDHETYIEPFLGSGAILATLAPTKAVASDAFPALMEIWNALSESPETLKGWYRDRRSLISGDHKIEVYEQIKADYNRSPNGADLVFLSRSCYGGVVRFRKEDGYMSTPCGVHTPISAESFDRRVDLWADRTSGTRFVTADFEAVLDDAGPKDMIYCDPPYKGKKKYVAVGEFDTPKFWDWASKMARKNTVLVSEADLPTVF